MNLTPGSSHKGPVFAGVILAVALVAASLVVVTRKPLLLARTDGSGAGGDSIARYFGEAHPGLNVVLISLDTLRADHLGCYGYERDTSPNLDRLAGAGTLFLNAYTAAPATAESHMTMLTALYPSVHRVETSFENKPVHTLDRSIVTLPEVLRRNGYRTAGIHGGGHVEELYGFGRGFSEYGLGGQADAERWIEKNGGNGKFFLFYHTYAVHDPYAPKPPYDTMFTEEYEGNIVLDTEVTVAGGEGNANEAFWSRVDKGDPADARYLAALYDGLIAQTDNELERLFAAIDRYAPDTVVIILSDHGEGFGEHSGFRHGRLYPEILEIPFIIRHPKAANGVQVSNPVSLIDLAPAILKMVGIELPEQFETYFPPGAGIAGETPIFAEFPVGKASSVTSGDLELIRVGDRDEFVELGEGNSEGPAAEARARARHRQLTKALEIFHKRNELAASFYDTGSGSKQLSPETLERLKSLGYIK